MKTIVGLLQDTQYDKKVILEKLVCHALDIKKEQLFTDMDREITDEQLARIDAGYKSYTIDKKPLEYILGRMEFLGVKFKVTPATLIPRPETEYMIEAVNEYIQHNKPTDGPPGEGGMPKAGGFFLLDIGTGCGVLGLSVLYHNPSKIAQAYLCDLSTEALEVAKENYDRLSSKGGFETSPAVSLLESNLLDHPTLQKVLGGTNEYPPGQGCGGGFDIILVANLPYIPEQLFEDNTDLGVKKREPKMAFVGGDDGLDLYRDMFDQLLETYGKKSLKDEYVTHDAHMLQEKGLTWKGGHIPYNKNLQERARELRKNMTKAEKKIWYEFLKDLDVTVNRQKIIDGYIVDFHIASAGLVIEIDGDSHFTDEGKEYDQTRTEILEQYDRHVLRYTNEEIYTNFEAVCENILEYIEKLPPTPLGQRGENEKPPLTKHAPSLDAGEVPTEEAEDGNGTITMFLEMMTRQVDILRQEYKNAFTFEEVKTFHFNIRIVKAQRNKQ